MKSSRHGTTTSEVEVTQIDAQGIWLCVKAAEYFLPYTEYPWFRDARLREILQVELLHGNHLRWPALDVDLCIESLANPEAFPLKYE
jgi:hypothetical protein